jgi:hypothetical protein
MRWLLGVGIIGAVAGCRTPQPTPTPAPVEPPTAGVAPVEQAGVEQAGVEYAPDYDELLDRADELLGEHELEQALASFLAAVEVRPDELLPRSGVAVCLLELGRFDEAEAVLLELQAAAQASGDEELASVIEHNLGELAERRQPAPKLEPCTADLSKTSTTLRHYTSYLAAWNAVATGDILDYVEDSPKDEDAAREQICGDCSVGIPKVFGVGDDQSLLELHLALPTETGVALEDNLGSIMGGRCTPVDVDVDVDADTDPELVHVEIYETSNWEDDSPFPIWDPDRGRISACYVEEGSRRDLFIDVARRRIVAVATREDPRENDPADSITLERDGDLLTLSGCGRPQQLRL